MLIDGLSGAAIGALIASPLNAVVTGIGVGVVGFTQSIITDAYTNDWDLSKVRWGNAVAFGVLTGLVSGAGHKLISMENVLKYKYNSYMQQSFPILAVFTIFGTVISNITDVFVSALNNLIGKIFN